MSAGVSEFHDREMSRICVRHSSCCLLPQDVPAPPSQVMCVARLPEW